MNYVCKQSGDFEHRVVYERLVINISTLQVKIINKDGAKAQYIPQIVYFVFQLDVAVVHYSVRLLRLTPKL